MDYANILITGGAGFVGSSLAIGLTDRYEGIAVTAADNLKRRGSELNIERLRERSIAFLHADLRCPEDLEQARGADLIIDCCAEPSVQAGYDGSGMYVVNTNLMSSVQCLEYARRCGADVVFLSTSRVYPAAIIDSLLYDEAETRFVLRAQQALPGVSSCGIAENFPLFSGSRSLYGATKLASEILVQEYADMYGLRALINRFGVIAGPWQMGKVDQGVAALWMARHVYEKPLQYIGYGGQGKQVRDIVHIDDAVELICRQLGAIEKHCGHVYNAGGGPENSVSLFELTAKCAAISGKKIPITSCPENRRGDVRYYVSDSSKVREATGWVPAKTVDEILSDIHAWILSKRELLSAVF